MVHMGHFVILKQANANALKTDLVKHVLIVFQAIMDHLDVKNVTVMVLVKYVHQLAYVLIVKGILKEIIVKGMRFKQFFLSNVF